MPTPLFLERGVLQSQALGVDFQVATASDTDAIARAFVQKNFGLEVLKLHESMESQINDPEQGCDLFVAGIPCKPFSRQRVKRFQRGSVKSHASHGTLFEEFCPWLDEHDPKCGVFENVEGLDAKIDSSTEETPLQMSFASAWQQF